LLVSQAWLKKRSQHHCRIFQSNWDNRRVPGFNSDKEKTLASIDKLARVLDDKHAQLWINHDKPSNDARLHAPAFYE